jgi:hypothetical protein
MSSTASAATACRTRKRARANRDANAGEAIPGILNDIVVAHILALIILIILLLSLHMRITFIPGTTCLSCAFAYGRLPFVVPNDAHRIHVFKFLKAQTDYVSRFRRIG